jgi:hypothetical protein
MILFQLFATSINDNSGTGGKICRRCHRISPRIFEKILKDPNVIFRDLGEDDS